MDINLYLDDLETLQRKIETRANNLFQAAEKSSLQVIRVFTPGNSREKPGKTIIDKNQKVSKVTQIEFLKAAEDDCQIFIVRHDRCWERLNIQRALLEHLVCSYGVCEHFWKCIFAFGLKQRENEFDFPRFRRRSNRISNSSPNSYREELMYVVRQAELNGRGGTNPWSIRQTAVYHREEPASSSAIHISAKCTRSIFLMIAPTRNAEMHMTTYLEENAIEKRETSSWNLHRLIISDSLSGWPDYMASLEMRLREQTNLIICAGGDVEEVSSSESEINFDTRQELKILEDYVLDLLMILATKVDTIASIRDQCKVYPEKLGKEMAAEEKNSHAAILREFDEYVKDAESYLARGKDLKERIQSTVILLSDFLSHEENKSMHRLAERSTKDAAAVKILTIITLIYLPTTIVANFFSTEFVQTSDSGHMTLTGNSWILAAISIPLTTFTIGLWWAWIYFTESTAAIRAPKSSHASRQNSFQSLISTRKNSFKKLSFFRNKRRDLDIEGGIIPPSNMLPPSHSPDSGGTWSSTAKTLGGTG